MDTFTVLENEGFPIGENVQRKSEIIELLRASLTGGYKNLKAPKIRRTRKEKYFAKNIEVTLIDSPDKNYSMLEINCPDQSGVLACVGEVLASNEINIKDARITTLGERVEDLFFVTDNKGLPINQKNQSEELCAEIKYQLKNRL